MVTIHYFYDPMCGWCYGATPLIQSIVNNDNFQLIMHSGGMLHAQAIEPSFRQHILEHDQRISKLTGVKFGQPYMNRIVTENVLVLDSYLPTRAILVGESLGIEPFVLLKAIQNAHYVKGKAVDKQSSLEDIAGQLGLNLDLWRKRMQSEEKWEDKAIDASHQLMAQLQIQGFPSLILEDNGNFIKLPHSQYYGNVDSWNAYLESLT